MNNPYGSRADRDDRERRALRDSRDQRHGEHYDDQFPAAGSRQSYSRDNAYRFDENRGRVARYDSSDAGGWRSSDDLFYGRSGQSDWSSRSDPRQQRSFERAGYDSDREFWEGQGSQAGRHGQGRFGSEHPEYDSGAGRYGGSNSSGIGYGSGPQRQQDFSQPSGSHYNDWAHAVPGGYQPGQQHDGGSPDNYWQHGGRFGAGTYPGGGYRGAGYQGSYQGTGGYQSGSYGAAPMSGAARNRPPKGYTRSDERLMEDICEQLTHNPFIDAGEVSVQVKEGKVTLEGSVPERSMKHCAEDIVEACSGVKDVDNRIRVSREQAGSKSK